MWHIVLCQDLPAEQRLVVPALAEVEASGRDVQVSAEAGDQRVGGADEAGGSRRKAGEMHSKLRTLDDQKRMARDKTSLMWSGG